MVCHFAAPGLVLLSRTLPQFTCCKVNDKERATAVTSDKVKFICIQVDDFLSLVQTVECVGRLAVMGHH